jgi:predicted metal-dependent phosphoesterase TrpH
MYKMDLHTHSVGSPDGGLSLKDYRAAIESGELDYIAVTDHNAIGFARKLKDVLGEAIIVSEEITTTEGHLIGLYLDHAIEPGRDASTTADLIHKAGGLVYVPHPFEKLGRKGLSLRVLNTMVNKIDIIEVYNGRAASRRGAKKASEWAKSHNKATASSSDSHGNIGWKRSYSKVKQLPNKLNLTNELKSPELVTRSVGITGRLYPKLNRLKRRAMHA